MTFITSDLKEAVLYIWHFSWRSNFYISLSATSYIDQWFSNCASRSVRACEGGMKGLARWERKYRQARKKTKRPSPQTEQLCISLFSTLHFCIRVLWRKDSWLKKKSLFNHWYKQINSLITIIYSSREGSTKGRTCSLKIYPQLCSFTWRISPIKES